MYYQSEEQKRGRPGNEANTTCSYTETAPLITPGLFSGHLCAYILHAYWFLLTYPGVFSPWFYGSSEGQRGWTCVGEEEAEYSLPTGIHRWTPNIFNLSATLWWRASVNSISSGLPRMVECSFEPEAPSCVRFIVATRWFKNQRLTLLMLFLHFMKWNQTPHPNKLNNFRNQFEAVLTYYCSIMISTRIKIHTCLYLLLGPRQDASSYYVLWLHSRWFCTVAEPVSHSLPSTPSSIHTEGSNALL